MLRGSHECSPNSSFFNTVIISVSALQLLRTKITVSMHVLYTMTTTDTNCRHTQKKSRMLESIVQCFLFTANVQWNILGSFRSNNQFVIALNTDQAELCAFTIPCYVYVECLQYACSIWLTRFRLKSFIVSFFYSESTHSTNSVNTVCVKILWMRGHYAW